MELFAQSSPTGVSYEAIGIWFVIGGFVIKTVLDIMHRKTQSDSQFEQAHKPGIDHKIDLKVTASEKRAEARLKEARDEIKKETEQLHGRVSGVRDDVQKSLDRFEEHQTQQLARIATSVDETAKSTSNIDGQLKLINQQVNAVQQQLQAHTSNHEIHRKTGARG